MHLVVIGPTYPFRGGIAHYTTLLVKHLREAGHRVDFLSFVRQYPSFLFPGRTDRDPSRVVLRVECEYLVDPLNPLTWVRTFWRIRQLRPDLLLLQWWVPYWTPTLSAISWLVKTFTSVPIVFLCHNVVPHGGGGIFDRNLSRFVLRHGDYFLVHSHQDLGRLQALLPGARGEVIPLPTYQPLAEIAVADGERLRRRLGLEGKRVLLFFGFVRLYKGLDYLLQALALLKEEFPDLHLLVAGEFWIPRAHYEAMARDLGIADRVTFEDRYVPNEEVGAYFGLADAVVLPYIEATQSAIVQLAFGFGVPVISTDVGGLREAVEDGVTGLLVPPCDPEALAEAVRRFYVEGLGASMRQGIEARRERFSWERVIRSLEGVLEAVR